MATQTPYRATAEAAQPPGHGGLRSYGAMAFFAQPPREIGPVLSAESTLSDGVVAVTPAARAVAQVAGALSGALAFAGLMSLSGYPALMVFASVPAGVALGWLLARHVTTVHPEADFVGVDGVAVARGDASPDRFTWRVLRFADAANLRVERRTTSTGASLITSAKLVWYANDGREVFSLSDDVPTAMAGPLASSRTLAAEAAWTRWRIARALDASGGSYPTMVFPMREGRIKLGESQLLIATPAWEGAFDRRACTITTDDGRLRIVAPHAPSQELRCALDVPTSEVADLSLFRVLCASPTAAELVAAKVPGAHPALHIPERPPREPTNNRGRFVLAVLCLSLVALVGSVALAVTAASRRQRVLLVDNPSLVAVDVTLDREPARRLNAGRHRRFEVREGRHTIVARGTDGRVESMTFTVPTRRHPADGWYALWRAAGDARYAVVTVVYGADERPAVSFVGDGESLVSLDDPELIGTFDEPFSREERLRPGAEKRVTHLCRVVQGIASGCGVE